MWKIAACVLIVIFVIADSIYLYSRLKKYWQKASTKRQGPDKKKWGIGLTSLDIPVNAKKDAKNNHPAKP